MNVVPPELAALVICLIIGIFAGLIAFMNGDSIH